MKRALLLSLLIGAGTLPGMSGTGAANAAPLPAALSSLKNQSSGSGAIEKVWGHGWRGGWGGWRGGWGGGRGWGGGWGWRRPYWGGYGGYGGYGYGYGLGYPYNYGGYGYGYGLGYPYYYGGYGGCGC